jgi:ABC-type sugar transport system permease subunit
VPGLIVLGFIALFPLIYQIAMSLTDLSSLSLRDGMRGGVLRAVGEGLTGQAQPVTVALFERSTSNQVRYAGPQVLLNLLAGGAADLVIFELVWTITAVSLQTAFGVGVALMLSRVGGALQRFTHVVHCRGLFPNLSAPSCGSTSSSRPTGGSACS